MNYLVEKAEKNRDLGKKMNCLVEKAEKKNEIWIKYELHITLSFWNQIKPKAKIEIDLNFWVRKRKMKLKRFCSRVICEWEREREKDEEVWMSKSEKEREEAEEVGMKEEGVLCGIRRVRRKEWEILFFLIYFFKVQNYETMTR